MTHKQAVESIRKFVKDIGGSCYVLPQSQRLHGSAGIADLEVIVPKALFGQLALARAYIAPLSTRLLFKVEVKVGADRASAAQCDYHYCCEQSGIHWMQASCAADVAAFLGIPV